MKDVKHYIAKREEAQVRLKKVEKLLKMRKNKVRWVGAAENLEKERSSLIDDIHGYNTIIAHLESGIRLRRYHHYRCAFNILNREYYADRRKKGETNQ